MVDRVFHLDFRKLYVQVASGSWVDISEYVLTTPPIHATWGFTDDNPLTSRVASTGQMTITLRNEDGLFTPDGPNKLEGWQKGNRVLLEVSFGGNPYARFSGLIQDIPYDSVRFGSSIPVTVVDWMDQTSKAPADLIRTETNKLASDSLRSVINGMPIKPLDQTIDNGLTILPFPFSASVLKTKALTEISRLTNSEAGMSYVLKDPFQGETFRFENSQARHGHRPLTKIPAPESVSFLLKAGTTDKILKAGSATDRILLSANEGASLENIFGEGGVEVKKESRVLNSVEVTAHPSRRDTFTQVMFALQQPIPIAAGEIIKIKGNFVSPTSGAQAGGLGMLSLVATTDYRAFVNSNATGTEFTASIVVDEIYGGGGFSHTVINNSALSGYITLFNVRGLGVYFETSVSSPYEDEPSQHKFGEISSSLEMKYQLDTNWGEPIAKSVLEIHKDGESDVKRVSFCANLSYASMYAFLILDIGSLIHVQSDLANVDDWFFINKVTFDISVGDFIYVTYDVVKHWSYNSPNGFEPLSVEFRSTLNVLDKVNFGYLPYVNASAAPIFAWSCWIYMHQVPAAGDNFTIAAQHSASGRLFWVNSADGVNFQVRFRNGLFGTTGGQWQTPNNPFTINNWVHVLVGYNVSSIANDPVIYINNTLQVLTESSTPAGTILTDVGVPLIIGGRSDANQPFHGEIKDFRVYNRIPISAEVTTLFNGGTPSNAGLVTDGLLFQAFAIKKRRLAEYENVLLTSDLKLFDNMLRTVGTPSGEPMGRSF
jgi:hypothetical protein